MPQLQATQPDPARCGAIAATISRVARFSQGSGTLQRARPADKALSWRSILGIGLLVVVLHQIALVPLSIYSIARGETLPENVLIYIFYILCWPFALVSRFGFTKNSVLIVSWFLGSSVLGFGRLFILCAVSQEASA